MELGFAIFTITVAAFAGWLWRDLTGCWDITGVIEASYDDGHIDGYDKGYMDGYRQCEADARADANGR